MYPLNEGPSMPLTFRIYVCSHFTDTKAERDYLHEVVFPELRHRLGPTGCRLEVVDLRREATSEADAEGTSKLPDALHKIGECRPWFLCLLGGQLGPALASLPDDVLATHPGL